MVRCKRGTEWVVAGAPGAVLVDRDLLLVIFTFLETPKDWDACMKVCRLWRHLLPMARPRALDYRELGISAMMWLARHKSMLVDLRSCNLWHEGEEAGQALLRLIFTSARKLEVLCTEARGVRCVVSCACLALP